MGESSDTSELRIRQLDVSEFGKNWTLEHREMAAIGKMMVMGGLLLAVVGGVLWGLSAAFPGLRLGRLPGDISVERDGFSMHVPITTMILVSLALTGVMWLVSMVRR
ncbi:DUF2905 domain-containing protein [Kamptonema cortianum]|nr:DUF2905 domain-containing protein [Geitlerinema splendidum]MDK3161058.1 DUF2905 domain-containing protein [Kamptonema cortianum]